MISIYEKFQFLFSLAAREVDVSLKIGSNWFKSYFLFFVVIFKTQKPCGRKETVYADVNIENSVSGVQGRQENNFISYSIFHMEKI